MAPSPQHPPSHEPTGATLMIRPGHLPPTAPEHRGHTGPPTPTPRDSPAPAAASSPSPEPPMPGTGVPGGRSPPAPPAAPYRCPVLAASAAPAECSGAEGRRRACLAARSLPSHLAGGAARAPPHREHPAPPAPAAPRTPRGRQPGPAHPESGPGIPRERGFPPGRLQSTWQTGKQRQGAASLLSSAGSPGGSAGGGHRGPLGHFALGRKRKRAG